MFQRSRCFDVGSPLPMSPLGISSMDGTAEGFTCPQRLPPPPHLCLILLCTPVSLTYATEWNRYFWIYNKLFLWALWLTQELDKILDSMLIYHLGWKSKCVVVFTMFDLVVHLRTRMVSVT